MLEVKVILDDVLFEERREDLEMRKVGGDASFCMEARSERKPGPKRKGCEVRAWPSLERGHSVTGGKGCDCQAPSLVSPPAAVPHALVVTYPCRKGGMK